MSEMESRMDGGGSPEPPTVRSLYFLLATAMGLFAIAFGSYVLFSHWNLLRWKTSMCCIMLVCIHTIYQWFRVVGYFKAMKAKYTFGSSLGGGNDNEDPLSLSVRGLSMVLLNSYGITLVSLYAINLILEGIEGR
jgi:hypothetical protein